MNCRMFFVGFLLMAGFSLQAHDSDEKLKAPGYRPLSQHAGAFLKAGPKRTIAVFPGVVLLGREVSISEDAQLLAIRSLEVAGLGIPEAFPRRLEPSVGDATNQWKRFMASRERWEAELRERPTPTQYALALEYLLTHPSRGGLKVEGIQCYLIDRLGNNAFSFLMNSHHRMFADAHLLAGDTTAAARDELVRRATHLALRALEVLTADPAQH